ncbi:uncharacterized protein BX664DRAFT_338208 [Halteromyces radiatus]|uniref:uncharacterized protein n=1 Tax=Halteromyces radiatus TaxID=101107 RepID=UPI002220E385|nr:uncharacterized protein BX664DRAFT_338208 [Halteromyces radiatus]KAI8084965.1 hypothetical protein BX664DRAFT_338208 [Halteromyces radiatus]
MLLSCFALPWKKKRGARSKSIIMPNLATSELASLSSVSLPLSTTRNNNNFDTNVTTSINNSNNNSNDDDDDQHLDNDDYSIKPAHPTTLMKSKRIPLHPPCYPHEVSSHITPRHPSSENYTVRRHYTIEKREEEGKEDLPPYECTVYKMGYMMIKTELEGPTKKSKKRSWRKLYMVLWGTTIRAYKTTPLTELEEKKPVWCYSMQDAEAGQASDYRKRRHVIRLRIHQGPQFLIRTKGEDEQLGWIEHLQASVNVSLDLDQRKMPQFITSSRRRRRARLNHDRNSPHQRYHQREGALI